MAERRGTKALELWCKRMTEGYPGVKVDNMTTSWRDGLAFCAIIHHFRPELIDFSKLNKDDVFHNNDLAFTVAEKYLGIPALLEPEDMVEYDVPDRLSILTYLSQFYKAFVASQGSSPARLVPKRPANSSDRGGTTSPASTSPPTKMALRTSGVPRREPCAKCGNPVYIAERLTVGKSLYHRTCFRCARCNSQLTLANYYETETPNQFCCETCPDEEPPPPPATPLTSVKDIKTDEKSMLSRSLSDEEKSAGLKNLSDRLQMAHDEYSAQFETALEDSLSKTHEYSKARSQFLSANLADETSDSETPPELPKTKPPDIIVEAKATPSSGRNETKDKSGVSVYHTPYSPKLGQRTHDINRISASSASEKQKTNDNLKAPSIGVVNQSSINITNLKKNMKKDEVTKDKSPINDVRSNTVTPSLVKNRMKLFETTTQGKDVMREELNLKRPLVDATVVSPEKRISRDSPSKIGNTSPTSPVSSSRKSVTETPTKSAKEIAQTQAKSLNFLLHKQIALKEGKISPKSIIDQAKTESTTNVYESKAQKPKSLENLTAKPVVSISKSTTSEDLAKSLLKSPTRKSIEENKIKFALGNPMFEKISPEKEKRAISDITPASPGSPYRLKKQQSMEETSINKAESATRTSFSKNWKDGRKENVYQSPFQNRYKSTEARIGSSPSVNDNGTKTPTFKDYTSPYRKYSLESPLRTGFGLIDRVESPRESGLDKKKLRSGLYTSDTELNNILNRNVDNNKSNLLTSKSTGCLPMRSIENLYRSNSEENIRFRNEIRMKSDTNIDRQSKANSVSALKNMFECVSVVQSSPTTCLETKDIDIRDVQPTESEGTDVENRSVSEIVRIEESHGEILRDGHITAPSTEHPKESTNEDRSEYEQDVIVVDLTEDSSSECIRKDAITISDDSVIEISDTSSLSQTATSDKSEENKLEPTDYPEDLNPFGDDDDDSKPPVDPTDDRKRSPAKKIKDSLNPFDDSEDEDEQEEETKPKSPKPIAAVRKKVVIPILDETHDGDTPEYVRDTIVQRISINPFEEDEDDEIEDGQGAKPPPVSGPPKKVISAPRISLNPFWSDVDEDEPEDDEDERKPKPVPKPRKFRNAAAAAAGYLATPEPKPRTSNLSNLSISALTFGSNSSLSSGQSGGQSVRKKKPAPRPPIYITAEAKNESANESSLTSSPSTSVSHSPRLPIKYRKSKKAPLPPSSTPQVRDFIHPNSEITDISPISNQPHPPTESVKSEDASLSTTQEEWSSDKYEKDKVNENRRSQTFNNQNIISPQSKNAYQDYIPNKSTYGKWKRKKGPAPSRPVPQRRMIKALPVCEFRKELDLIELQKQGLEKQGVRLEQIIRDRCEGPERDENIGVDDDTVPIDVEDLILQLFEVVNEKNELSRREAEIMYLQRQQRLEEEHAETEYQIRCLMMQPELNKTDSDKAKEEELIQRLVEIVERRNEIVECLEMDRLREAEEDDSISTSLNTYASRRDEQIAGNVGQIVESPPSPEEVANKKEKIKKVKKEKKKKKSDKLDADKDVDESESSITSIKEKKKKKFALF
ncbi:calponin y domain-containing protein [Holotrichia oblita]|uniref:Calponin y domain-containing protein n=1 Tax=Holotrichia oblita TaxID=644536 RepID=A0ACB9T610_HOLOL|nr:calponin y domain-containing protein [Holotrichia oblita]